ncbi:MAG: invasion associated locus B family protein [Rickettsiales bacterium]|nr:invasion associated locus B family protein [Rickettsiales bacterium]
MELKSKVQKNSIIILFFLVFVFTLSLQKSFAQQTLDGIYYDWSVFVSSDLGEEKKCYIASFPDKSIGNYKDSREPYVLITRFQDRGNEEVSVYSGFEYKISSNIYISVDGKQYTLFTNDDMAWAKDKSQDKEIIEGMLNGKTLKIRAESSHTEYVVDEYSLKGMTRAYRRMKELCK